MRQKRPQLFKERPALEVDKGQDGIGWQGGRVAVFQVGADLLRSEHWPSGIIWKSVLIETRSFTLYIDRRPPHTKAGLSTHSDAVAAGETDT